jgi:osmotically-inducible protein OsmY
MRIVSLLLILVTWLPLLVAQGTPKDDRIYDQVRQKLSGDADVGGAAIEVTVKDGVVTLSGRVRTEKAKGKAEKIAKKVKGVTSVVNQLKLINQP